MDFRHLRYFVAIVESGTLTEASRRLHIVQPALSQRMAALEADVGVRLLVRGRTGVAVTDAGQELYQRARLILKQAEAAKTAVQEKAGVASGCVRIGLLRSLAPLVGPTLFRTINAELPGVRPDVIVGYSEELMQQLRSVRLDVSLGVQPREEFGLEGSYLYSEGVHLLGDARFVPAGGVDIAALRGVPLLVRSTRGPIHGVLEAQANKLGFSLHVVGSIEDQASVIDLCSSGTVATYVPDSTARHLTARNPSLVSAPILEAALARKVFVYTHAEVPKTGAVIAIEEIIERVVGAYTASTSSQS